ncbi:MAG: FHA domain-containing protein [Acidobacteria bacterium]|nr:FHA domain-containing protein [Acidobacteriota bacterium]
MSERSTSFLTLLRQPPEGLPAELDLLVVGAGPAGTAAAFRARELGLSALVIEYDDVLKRIRDYSKSKLILPGFGGGDRLRFPKGGALLDRLRFAPTDKDDLHRGWKGLYLENQVPIQIGLELTALEDGPDGLLLASAWDHTRRQEARFRTFAVLLAVGRGVPRRFDVPGNTDGIAYRLSDPDLYVGHPALVLGGGTSAAEAVIAISNAKIAAGDESAVYWSYRGTKMPRVSKALAEVFFEAWVGNGNIRYYPRSEPAAVVVGDDRREYLALRVARRCLPGEPSETTLLEFPKEHCIACIGEDAPLAFLASLGVPLYSDEAGRKRMLVTAELESARPNVFLAGDLLAQSYLEAESFPADPETCREVKHPGNIKNALRDGTRVAQVVALRRGKSALASAEVADAEEADAEAATAEAAPAAAPGRAPEAPPRERGPAGSGGGVPPSRPPASPALRLLELTPAGVEAEEHLVPAGGTFTVGRRGSDLSFPEDESLGEPHVTLEPVDGVFRLVDHGAAGGSFLRLPPGEARPLTAGDQLRAGRQFLLLEGRCLRTFDASGRETGRHEATQRAIILGRDAPDVVLDAADPSLSRRHLAVAVKDGSVTVKDLGSANGTFLRIRGSVLLAGGAEIQLGRRFFRLVTEAPPKAPPDLPAASPPPLPTPKPKEPTDIRRLAAAVPATAAREEPTGPAGAPSVVFRGVSAALPIAGGQTLCDVAEAHGLPLRAECHAGICGSDPIRILSGSEHLDPVGDGESDTLRDLCGLEPGTCRLACMVKARGPVEVEIVES